MGFSIRRTRELGSIGVSVPTASVMPYAGSTSPSGWLLCFGQAISRTQYADLFAAIGTAYGTGDGSTTFNLPDLRGRVVAGVDNMGGSAASRLTSTTITGGADAVGEVGGAQTHTLTGSEIPSHSHFISAAFGDNANPGPYPYYAAAGGGSSLLGPPNGMTSAGSGGGAAHNNVQPTMVLNYIIKA